MNIYSDMFRQKGNAPLFGICKPIFLRDSNEKLIFLPIWTETIIFWLHPDGEIQPSLELLPVWPWWC